MIGNVPLNELCEILQKWWKWRFMKRKWKSSCLTIFYSEKSLWSVLFLERSRIILDKPISVPKKKIAAQRSVTQPYIRPHTVVTPLRFFFQGRCHLSVVFRIQCHLRAVPPFGGIYREAPGFATFEFACLSFFFRKCYFRKSKNCTDKDKYIFYPLQYDKNSRTLPPTLL